MRRQNGLWVDLFLLASGIAAVALLWQESVACVLAILSLSALRFVWMRDIDAIPVFVAGLALGTCGEIVATGAGIWCYATPDFAGIPLWVPFGWGFLSVHMVRVAEGVSSAHRYSLYSEWRAEAQLREVEPLVAEAVADPTAFVRYWPEANVAAEIVEPGLQTSLHRKLAVRTRGFLPYQLRWTVQVTRAQFPNLYEMRVTGDFHGVGVWRIDQENDEVVVRFDWAVSVHKPIVRSLSWLLRPLFIANHRWAMARGEDAFHRLIADGRRSSLRETNLLVEQLA